MHRVKRFAAGLAVAAACAGVQGKPLPDVDVLAQTPAAKRRLPDAVAMNRFGVQGHADERLGVPNFLRVQPGSPVRTKGSASPKQQLRGLAPLYGVAPRDIDGLETFDTQALPNGARLLRLRQQHDGVHVFRGQVSLLTDRDGQLAAVSGQPAPLPAASGAKSLPMLGFVLDEAQAIERVLDAHGLPGAFLATRLDKEDERDAYRRFTVAAAFKAGHVVEPLRLRPVWFRRPDGLEPAWYVETDITTPADGRRAHAQVLSARDGVLLWRRNLIAHDAYRYRVWADPVSLRPLAGPQGNAHFPHPAGVPDGSQPAFVAPASVTLQNVPFSRNDPWLPPSASRLAGNNVDAFADLYSPDGFNDGDVRATPSSPGAFDRIYDTTRAPDANATQVQASVTQAFYTANWLHDGFYDVGFDEAAGNAQADNYARGGRDGDALRVDVQDASGRNNANMSTPADGAPPRMQLFVFDGLSRPTITLSPGSAVIAAAGAGYGPQTYALAASMVEVLDGVAAAGGTLLDGCETPVQAIGGRIALVDRGGCSFAAKAKIAQAAGAVALIVANDIDVGAAPVGGSGSGVSIPVLGVTRAEGLLLRNRIAAGTPGAALKRSRAVDRDGALDAGIVAHEWGHYISNRLVGDAAGLANLQGYGMGEGWGDFHALMLLAAPGKDPAGAWAAMGHANGGEAPNNSYYFGLRRFPYSTDLAKNPLTFRHVQDSVPLPVTPYGRTFGANSEPHATGEVWASMLWECYAGLLADAPRLSFAQAEERMKRYLVAGYKLTPHSPTMLEARDALLAAMQAEDPKDFAACARGFAKRGAGAGAIAPARDAAGNEGVVESYIAEGGALALVSARISDALGACDLDGRLDGGELGTLEVTWRNGGFAPLRESRVDIASSSPGVAFPEGTRFALAPTSPYETTTALVPIAYEPASGPRTIDLALTWTDPRQSAPGRTTLSYLVNADFAAQALTYDDAEAPLPAWTATGATGDAKAWRRIELWATQHRFLGPDGDGVGAAAWVSPVLKVASGSPLVLTFRHRHDFEASAGTRWDGGVIEASRDDGATWIDIGAWAQPGYGGTLSTSAGNPLGGRPAFTARNAAYPALETVTVNLGTAFAGQAIRVRFVVGTDLAAGGAGWEIDDIAFTGLANTPFPGLVAQRTPCHSASFVGARVFGSGFE